MKTEEEIRRLCREAEEHWKSQGFLYACSMRDNDHEEAARRMRGFLYSEAKLDAYDEVLK